MTGRATLYVSILRHEPITQRNSFSYGGLEASVSETHFGEPLVALHLSRGEAQRLIVALEHTLNSMDKDLEHIQSKQEA